MVTKKKIKCLSPYIILNDSQIMKPQVEVELDLIGANVP